MVALLLVFSVIFAVAGLIWYSLTLNEVETSLADCNKSLKGRLQYVVISPALLSEWEAHEANLIVVDLRPELDSGGNDDAIANSLRIPVARLATELRWVPPATRLVFYGGDWVGPFNAVVEEALLCAGIEAVYLLEGGPEAWHASIAQNGTLLRGTSAPTLPGPQGPA
jgi:rhodanese-related sulfurtransferase